MTTDKLLRLVCDAFADLQMPKGETIASSAELEPQAIQTLLFGRPWTTVDAALLLSYGQDADTGAMPFFLSPEAFRYYLPAFLTFIVSHYSDAGTLIDALLLKLKQASDELAPCTYSQRQRLTILSFLEYLKASHSEDAIMGREIDRALAVWA